MGYDCILFRTPEKEITVEEKLSFRRVYTLGEGLHDSPVIRRDVTAKEILWLYKAYWLVNIIEEIGEDAKDFIYLSKENMRTILYKSMECGKNKEEWRVKKHFHTGPLTSYEDMVIWEQFKYFNRVVSQLLRNQREVHYWYLKP